MTESHYFTDDGKFYRYSILPPDDPCEEEDNSAYEEISEATYYKELFKLKEAELTAVYTDLYKLVMDKQGSWLEQGMIKAKYQMMFKGEDINWFGSRDSEGNGLLDLIIKYK